MLNEQLAFERIGKLAPEDAGACTRACTISAAPAWPARQREEFIVEEAVAALTIVVECRLHACHVVHALCPRIYQLLKVTVKGFAQQPRHRQRMRPSVPCRCVCGAVSLVVHSGAAL